MNLIEKYSFSKENKINNYGTFAFENLKSVNLAGFRPCVFTDMMMTLKYGQKVEKSAMKNELLLLETEILPQHRNQHYIEKNFSMELIFADLVQIKVTIEVLYYEFLTINYPAEISDTVGSL